MTTQTIEQVPATAWQEWASANGATTVDVREPMEWAMGTLPGAELIPLGELHRHVDRLDRQRPLLLVCRSGNRSNTAAAMLARIGFTTANLSGGMLALGRA